MLIITTQFELPVIFLLEYQVYHKRETQFNWFFDFFPGLPEIIHHLENVLLFLYLSSKKYTIHSK